jgi:hypothetical protein
VRRCSSEPISTGIPAADVNAIHPAQRGLPNAGLPILAAQMKDAFHCACLVRNQWRKRARTLMARTYVLSGAQIVLSAAFIVALSDLRVPPARA